MKPHEAWNAVVNLLATENYADLDGVQRAAQLCFWYDSEVQNGGHLQYFANRGISLIAETLASLDTLGAVGQRKVLDAAHHLFLRSTWTRLATVADYVTMARENEFGALDSAYYACQPSIQQLLATFFARHREHFIEVTDGHSKQSPAMPNDTSDPSPPSDSPAIA